MVESIAAFFKVLPFTSTTWIVLAVLTFMCFVLNRASNIPSSRVDWEDLFIDSVTDRLSRYAVGYVVGLIIGTWTVLALVDQQRLTFDIFGLYLAYLLGGASWNSWVQSKVKPIKESSDADSSDIPKP